MSERGRKRQKRESLGGGVRGGSGLVVKRASRLVSGSNPVWVLEATSDTSKAE